MLRRLVACALVFGAAVACAAGSSESKSATPSGGNEWVPLETARQEMTTSEHDFQLAATDCQAACKALASLERAANHLCAVSEPEECTDARARVDRARRAVSQQCGGC